MTRHVYKTDRRLWLLASCCVFGALAFVDPARGMAKMDCSLEAHVSRLFKLGFAHTAEGLRVVLLMSAFVAVPAVILGWAVQALVVTLGSRRCAELPTTNLTPREQVLPE